MSFDQPGPDDKHPTEPGTEPDEGQEDAGRRPPREQDVTTGAQGKPVEPPD